MFRILKSIELQGWREQVIDMPLASWSVCPCDGNSLRTVSAIAGEGSSVRIGACPSCGYVGYRDRPEADWFADFYAAAWDQQEAERVDATVEFWRAKDGRDEELFQTSNHPIAKLAERVPFSPDARVFEMGVGYGWALACMKHLGYRHLSGVETCPHRARIAREGMGFDVRCEPLEHHQGGPYDVILSHHVLEHTYDPAACVRKLSSMQPEGGYLVLGVPNFVGEPTMGVLMFLPHLHSFTRMALRRLLASYGYAVIEDHSDDASQWVIARKTTWHPTGWRTNEDCFWGVEHKLRRGLPLRKHVDSEIFWWHIAADDGRYTCFPIQGRATVRNTGEWLDDKKREPRQLHVEPIRERRTDAPIEIQWEGPLRLFVK